MYSPRLFSHVIGLVVSSFRTLNSDIVDILELKCSSSMTI